MIKVSTRVRYATRALAELAAMCADGPTRVETLAERVGVSDRYLAKILQDLRRTGFVRSVRGARGGYVLLKDPSQTSVLELWEALEGPIHPVGCLQDPDSCGKVETCSTRQVWLRVQKGVQEALGASTIAELSEGCEEDEERSRGPSE